MSIEHGIDAIYAATPMDALAIAASRSSVKDDQILRAVFCSTVKEERKAMQLHCLRNFEIESFESFMKLEAKIPN